MVMKHCDRFGKEPVLLRTVRLAIHMTGRTQLLKERVVSVAHARTLGSVPTIGATSIVSELGCENVPKSGQQRLGEGSPLTVYVADPDFTLHYGDVTDVLPRLPDSSVHCVITSPPYWGLRDYGIPDRQLGLEATPDEYVTRMVAVF